MVYRFNLSSFVTLQWKSLAETVPMGVGGGGGGGGGGVTTCAVISGSGVVLGKQSN